MATIGDVAKAAGVSRSTVSSVLTGRKFVSPETRARIESAIDELHFSVNAGARALATSRTMTVGVMVRFHEAEFSPALAAYLVALSDAATASGYAVTLLTERDGARAVRDAIAGHRVDGLILLNVVEGDPRIEPIAESGFPAVLLGMPPDRYGIDAVDLDFASGARLLVDWIAARGHVTAHLIGWPEDLYATGATYARRFADAARARARERGVALEVLDFAVRPEAVREGLRALLRPEGRPDSIIVHNDAVSALLPQVLHELDVSVPADLNVVSLHSAELTQMFGLPFTSVESQPTAVSEAALRLLLARFADPASPARTELIAPSVIDRHSVR